MPPRTPRRRRTARTREGANPAVRDAVLEIIDNQLRDNDPPEVRQTLDRLIAGGFTEARARLYMGAAVLFEMNEVLRTRAPYQKDRYVAILKRLPELPGKDDPL
jgi:hypothetical protein